MRRLVALCVVALLAASGSAQARVRTYDLPRGLLPHYPLRGPDGKLWFTAWTCCGRDWRMAFGDIDGSGALHVVRESTDPVTDVGGGSLFGADGNLYGSFNEDLRRSTRTGHATPIETGLRKRISSRLALGYDGAVWFTSEEGAGGRFVGRLDPATDRVRLFTRGLRSSPRMLTRGPRRSLWFTDGSGDLWRAGMDGGLHRVPVPADPLRNGVVGDEHGLWLQSDTTGTGVLHLDARGRLRRTCRLPGGPPGWMAASSGALWAIVGGRALRVDPAGRVTRGGWVAPRGAFLLGTGADRGGGLLVAYATDHRRAGHIAVVDPPRTGRVLCAGLRAP